MTDSGSAKRPAGRVIVAPSMVVPEASDDVPLKPIVLGPRTLWLCLLSIALGGVGFAAAFILMKAIGLLTNLCFYGRWSFAFVAPTDAHLVFGSFLFR